jgi:FlaA1/EpsC-like NDP-sugar epimerase
MGSRGSVIPLFKHQIEQGQPLTVTVPEMTRFLLTLDQSVGLVFHAIQNAKGGEIFVRKAPACTVLRLAEVMRRKYSPQGDNHPISTVGIRPGEKIHEVLVNEYEMRRSSCGSDFFTIFPEYRRPEGASLVDAQGICEYTSDNTNLLDEYDELSSLLDQIGQVEYFL